MASTVNTSASCEEKQNTVTQPNGVMRTDLDAREGRTNSAWTRDNASNTHRYITLSLYLSLYV